MGATRSVRDQINGPNGPRCDGPRPPGASLAGRVFPRPNGRVSRIAVREAAGYAAFSGSAPPARFRANGRPAPALATRTRVHDSGASSVTPLPWRAFGHAIHPWRADAGRPAGKEMIMTQDKTRKAATRQRMAETGEPYSVARHAVEREHDASESSAAGNSDREMGVGEAGFGPPEHADRARQLAEEAQERAERVRERAERANEAAMVAHEAADMATEAANLTRGWADEQDAGAGAAAGRPGVGRGRGGAAPGRPGRAGGRPGAGRRRPGLRGGGRGRG